MALEKVTLFSTEELPLEKDADGNRIPPKAFRLFRAGWNESKKGTYLFDEEAAQRCIAAWKREGNPLMGDYNHDVFGPASITEFDLEVRDGELWAVNCSYTPRAFKALQDGEFRLHSPEFTAETESKRIVAIHAVALTNRPALLHLTPLVAATAINAEPKARAKENDMSDQKDQEIVQLRAENASLKEKANGSEIVALTAALGVTKPSEGIAAAHRLVQLHADVLGETGAKDAPGALGTIKAWKQDAAETKTLRTQLSALEQKSLGDELAGIIDKAVSEGKVTQAGKEAARAIALGSDGQVSRDGLVKLTAFVGTLSPRVLTETAVANGGGAQSGQEHVSLTVQSRGQLAANAAAGMDAEKQKRMVAWEQKLRSEGKWSGDLAATS